MSAIFLTLNHSFVDFTLFLFVKLSREFRIKIKNFISNNWKIYIDYVLRLDYVLHIDYIQMKKSLCSVRIKKCMF